MCDKGAKGLTLAHSTRIAIVGIGGVFPGSQNLEEFWDLIQGGSSATQSVPAGRWVLSNEDAYRASAADDHVYSTHGCFVEDFQLDSSDLDVDAELLNQLDPMFRIVLGAGQQAIADANMFAIDRQRIGVAIGNIALPTETASKIASELIGGHIEAQVLGTSHSTDPSGPTESLNRYVTGLPAGLLAKALRLGGGSWTLDAACASSLYSLKYAADELVAGRADAMLAGGLSRPDCLYTQMGFSALHALSESGQCSPFDQKADGLLVGEGSGIVVLKRLDDALRECDHIYATLEGIGLSNDIGGSLFSPDSEGQLRAMRDAYAQAGWSPASVDLVECHGTGTPVGDVVEFNSLKSMWAEAGAAHQPCVIGSVKSNVGHLLTAAGSAGLIKVLLAMKHGILPPTANFKTPSSKLGIDETCFEVLSEAKPWQVPSEHPRRAAISAFGFGGINAHVLIEQWGESSQKPGQVEVPEPSNPAQADIAIIGIGAHVGPWDSREAFRNRVLGQAGDVLPTVPSNWWGVQNDQNVHGYWVDQIELPVRQFRIPPAELKESLPQQLLMLKTTAEALDDAGLLHVDGPRLDTGVFIGLGLDLNTTNFHVRWTMRNQARIWADQLGLNLTDTEMESWVTQLKDQVSPPLTANRTMGSLGSIVASRVARAFKIGGPSFTLSSEETSGLHALQIAVRMLRKGDINLALAGAVDLAGDVRAVAGQGDRRPWSAQNKTMPFDQQADGSVVSEGSIALVLKRQEDAVRDGDRIYSVISGLGNATAEGVEKLAPSSAACVQAITQAQQEAGITPNQVDCFETHGSGIPAEDRCEAQALKRWWQGSDSHCMLSSAKSDVGHTGAAAGLVSIAKAALMLHHRVKTPMRGTGSKQTITQLGSQYELACQCQPWLHDAVEGPRYMGVHGMSVDGNSFCVMMKSVEAADKLVSPFRNKEVLFVLSGGDEEGIARSLHDLSMALAVSSHLSLSALGAKWHGEQHGDDDRRLVLMADSLGILPALIADGLNAVHSKQAIGGPNIFYNPEPLGAAGALAFVFPGSGNHYQDMGRVAGLMHPDVLEEMDQENDRFASQFAQGRFWQDIDLTSLSHQDTIFGQVWLGTMLSDVIRSYGVSPDAIIGYSLGETAGQFATRSWQTRDLMFDRMSASTLFTHDLTGPCDSVRRAWALQKDQTVQWQLGVVNRPADQVRQVLESLDRAYLLIINTPDECVIGGDQTQVQAAVEALECQLHVIEGVTTVHCEVAKPVEEAYRNLHLFETHPMAGVDYYSGIRGGRYQVTRDSIADSVTDQAMESFDYTRVIEDAYHNGVRLFIEMGPGRTCSRMIGRILDGRPHVAQPVSVAGRDESTLVLSVLAMLVAEGIDVNLDRLYAGVAVPPDDVLPERVVTVRTGAPPVRISVPQAHFPVDANPHESRLVPSAVENQYVPVESFSPAPVSLSAAPETIFTPVIRQMTNTQIAQAQAQQAYLTVSSEITNTLAQALNLQIQLLHQSGGATVTSEGVMPPAQPIRPELPSSPAPLYDREVCMEFAIGSIGRVFGPDFAPIDSHPTRVRLPDDPLMLVDRIMSLEGEARSMTSGRVVTEHDVLPGAWYLDGGRIPTCIAVEAGQADLFLSGYLGIDFRTGGLSVYRLLDAEITFQAPLPAAGKTIRYDITIEQFFQQGDTYLFRFGFEGTVDGQPLLTMRKGIAGFFSQEELNAGQGVVISTIDQRPHPGIRPDDWKDPVPLKRESYSDEQINALRQGDYVTCFGEAFADLDLKQPVGIPSGRMSLVHRILDLVPGGGRFGLGEIVGEADIHPDDWFITCHFCDDPVMPGTLMYECCLHTLRVYLLRMGWVGEMDEVVYEPIEHIASQLKCRGQVMADTQKVEYQVTIKEIGYRGPEQMPYVLADALMSADGKDVVQMTNMSVQLSGLTRQRVDAMWGEQPKEADSPLANCPVQVQATTPIYDNDSIVAYAEGKPSEAFGDRYKIFDDERKIARLPRDPYKFLDRVTSIKACQPWDLKSGGVIEAQYDIPKDAWYFGAERQGAMPFAVLLEVALQPCGWLAAYLGSALTSETDLKFRNLGGAATPYLRVRPDTGILTTQVKMTRVSQSGGMIIQNYDMETWSAEGLVYKGDTYFGFFSQEALANQVGITDAQIYQPQGVAQDWVDYPTQSPFPDPQLKMVDKVTHFEPQGGPEGLGFIEGIMDVNPDSWFFQAHFYEDPVIPGSLGLESMIQLLKVVAHERWDMKPESGRAFESLANGQTHLWMYRGQVVPQDERVTVQAAITRIDDRTQTLWAKGFLMVDGRIIYQMTDFALRVTNC